MQPGARRTQAPGAHEQRPPQESLPTKVTAREAPIRASLAHIAGGHDEQWRIHAGCKDHHDPSLWFPENGPAIEARTICASCPVRADCLQAALSEIEQHGIWGGLSERVRRHLRRLLVACPHPDRPALQYRCRCEFCKALREQDRRMKALARGEKVAKLDTNGPGAQHGKASTYARGCHCDACTEAMRESRARNRRNDEQEAVA